MKLPSLFRVQSPWLPVSFAGSVVAVGAPYWRLSYAAIDLPESVIHPGLIVVGAAALVLRSLGVVRFWRGAFIMGLAVPAAVMLRVIVEGVRDPSSHNLWPLEILIAWVVGSACALAGVILGSFLRRPSREVGDRH